MRKPSRRPEWVSMLLQEMLKPPLFLEKIHAEEEERKAKPEHEERGDDAAQSRAATEDSPHGRQWRQSRQPSSTSQSHPRHTSHGASLASTAKHDTAGTLARAPRSTTVAKTVSTTASNLVSTDASRSVAATARGGSTSPAYPQAKDTQPAKDWRSLFQTEGIPPLVVKNYGWKPTAASLHNGVVRVRTSAGSYALKPTELEPQRILFMQDAQRYLRQNGFTRMARLVPSKRKRPYVRQNGCTYYATKWIGGRIVNFANKQDVPRVAAALASFHEASRGFESSQYNPPMEFDLRQMLQRRFENLKILLAQAGSKRTPGRFDQLFLSMEQHLRQDAQDSVELLEDPDCQDFLLHDEYQPGLCHLDVIPGNFVCDSSGTVHIIDLDLMTYAPRVLDISHLLRRSLQIQNWDAELAYLCFLSFDSVRTLAKEEYLLILALLRFPYKAWRLANTRYRVFAESAQVDALREYVDKEDKRRQFLQELAEQIR